MQVSPKESKKEKNMKAVGIFRYTMCIPAKIHILFILRGKEILLMGLWMCRQNKFPFFLSFLVLHGILNFQNKRIKIDNET